MAYNPSIGQPTVSTNYRPGVTLPNIKGLYESGGPGSNAGINMAAKVLDSNAALGKEFGLQTLKNQSAETIAKIKEEGANKRVEMYKQPTLFDKLAAISSMFATENPNLNNPKALGLEANPLKTSINQTLSDAAALQVKQNSLTAFGLEEK